MPACPSALIDALIAQGAQRPHHRQQQRRQRRHRPRRAAQGAAACARSSARFRARPIRRHFDALYRAGEIELELVPQGTLAERIRAAGAGIGAFFTPTGYGTELAEGKETRAHRRPRLRARVSDPRRLRADQGRPRPTAGATSSTARPRATSGRSWRRRRSAPSCRCARSSSSATLDPEAIVTPGIFVQARGARRARRCRKAA